MTLEELKKYYTNGHQFSLRTGMSANSYRNWFVWGYIPMYSQNKLELLTKGELKADVHRDIR
jgi:hypothetical protein